YLKSSSESNFKIADPSGPTFSVHEQFWKESGYEKHILLYSSSDERDVKNFKKFVSDLKDNFKGRVIEGRFIPLEDVISVSEIISKMNSLLAEYAHDEIEAYISPGTPAMQTAWYLLGTTYKKNLSLFQTRSG